VIVCTGPISSGTRMMTHLVRQMTSEEVIHHSMPQWGEFWDGSRFPGARYVIITRRPDISVRSAHKAGHGNNTKHEFAHLDHTLTEDELDDWWWKAIDYLSRLNPACWVSYEAFITAPLMQLTNLAGLMGFTRIPAGLEDYISDQDAKWR
jgi:hypothetical protein